MTDSADYVIVGAGTAGCVLAARLSEASEVSVALLELGGPDSNPEIWDTKVSSLNALWNPESRENWGYRTVPQPGLNGRAIDVPRGKVVGGSSAINAMIYVRGNRRDFDGWAELGNRGWSYRDVLPHFKRSEAYSGPPSDYHGRDGPVSVIDCQNPSPASYAFVEAAAELGAAARQNDFNGASQEAGAGFYQSTRTLDGRRVTAASAFLTPNLARKRLRLLTRARVTRIIINGGRAVGVEYLSERTLHTLHANREVILCGGAFETPKLMMLSGIGPADELARHDISVVQNLPGVGANLQDHLMLGVAFASRVPLQDPELLAEAGFFTWSNATSLGTSPDLQYFFGPMQFVTPEYRMDGSAFTLTPVLAKPRSRGTVRLVSRNPAALARVDMEYLRSEDDIEVLEYGIRYARELAHTKAFDAFRGAEIAPGSKITSSTGLREYVRKVATTVWHASGTCSMGHDDHSVVDDLLRVHGVEGLRIVDASIMPMLVNANPNAAVMMIAEKAADLVLLHREVGRSDRSGDNSAVLGPLSTHSDHLPNSGLEWHHAARKGADQMLSVAMKPRPTPQLKFLGAVSLRFDKVFVVGEAPDGVRLDFNVFGRIDGPVLNGEIPPCAAYLRIDRDGIGTINVRAPFVFDDKGRAELEATGRYDFGPDGYQRAVAGDLPNSALGWCPRFFTGDPRYLWLNRAQCLGVGELRPKETRVDYDLYQVIPNFSADASAPDGGTSGARATSLYERLGRRERIYALMSASIDSLHGNEQLNRQNKKLGALSDRADAAERAAALKENVTDFICKLTGGPCVYRGKSLRASHAPLDITEADWRIFMEDFERVANEFGLRKLEKDELLALLLTTKGEIVKAP